MPAIAPQPNKEKTMTAMEWVKKRDEEHESRERIRHHVDAVRATLNLMRTDDNAASIEFCEAGRVLRLAHEELGRALLEAEKYREQFC